MWIYFMRGPDGGAGAKTVILLQKGPKWGFSGQHTQWPHSHDVWDEIVVCQAFTYFDIENLVQ